MNDIDSETENEGDVSVEAMEKFEHLKSLVEYVNTKSVEISQLDRNGQPALMISDETEDKRTERDNGNEI